MNKLILLLPLIVAGCASANYKSPEDYYKQRARGIDSQDSIDKGANSNNNILDSQDGNSYYNRTVKIFGATY